MTQRSTATKFTFDTVFADTPGASSKSSKGRQRRVLTQAEIDALCEQAREEGLHSGELQLAQRMADATAQAAHALKTVLQRSNADIEMLRAEAAKLALTAARTLARSVLSAMPAAEVETILRESLHQAIGEPRIVLRANPQVAEKLGPRLAEIAHEEGYEGRIHISADPAISGADCRIEWRGGGAERSEAALEAALNEVIARRFNHIHHPLSED